METQIDFLPIGSVVRLEGGNKRLMITGYAPMAEEEPEYVYDYCGCLYPEGVIRSEENYVFDHEDIEEVYFIGYEDEESKEYKIKVNETLSKMYEDDSEEEQVEEVIKPSKPLIDIESL